MKRVRVTWAALAMGVACAAPSSNGEADSDSSSSGAGSSEGPGSTSAPATTSGAMTDASETTADLSSSGGGSSTGDVPDPVPSAGCGLPPPDMPGEPIDVDGQERTFVLHLPNEYDPNRAYPLIFAWHGLASTGQVSSLYFGLRQSAGDDAIVVYPDGLSIPDVGLGWDLEPDGYDMDFFDGLLAHLGETYCVDSGRIFSTGHSFGGFMSNALACFRGDVLTAIAPVASGGPAKACDTPVAAWITHGMSDPTVPYAQGLGTRDFWVAQNGCTEETEPYAPDPCVRHLGCGSGLDVIWCPHDETAMLDGHDWPTFAGDGIWAFFSSF